MLAMWSSDCLPPCAYYPLEHTFGRREMDDVAIALEHVHLLNGLDGLHVHLLERGLQLLVVGAGVLMHLLDLSSRSSLASVSQCISHYCTSSDLDVASVRCVRSGSNFATKLSQAARWVKDLDGGLVKLTLYLY